MVIGSLTQAYMAEAYALEPTLEANKALLERRQLQNHRRPPLKKSFVSKSFTLTETWPPALQAMAGWRVEHRDVRAQGKKKAGTSVVRAKGAGPQQAALHPWR